METRDLTTKNTAKKPKNVRNWSSRARITLCCAPCYRWLRTGTRHGRNRNVAVRFSERVNQWREHRLV